MRRARFSLLALLLASASLRADDAADARAIVARAAKAAGIPTDGKPLAMTCKVKGQNVGGGFDNAFTGEMAFQAPDKFRMSVKSSVNVKIEVPRRAIIRRRIANQMANELNGITIDALVVANGNKAWMSVMGTSQELTGKQLEKFLDQAYQYHVISLAPLLTEKEFVLSTAGVKEVNGKKLAAVKVERNQKKPIALFFDMETGLLAKTERKGKEVLEEVYLEDYKEVGGRKYYTKMRLVEDGKPMVVDTMYDYQSPQNLDPKLFEIHK